MLFASDLSYQVLQRRRRRGELTLAQHDFSRELPYLVVQRPVIRFWDGCEGQVLLDQDETPIGFCYMTGKGRSK